MSARSFFDCFDRIDRFDPRQAQGGSDRPEVVSGGEGGVELTEQSVGPKAGAPRTVSDLLADIKAALAEGLPQEVVVVGEVSNFKRHGSGHLYFSLKDTGGQISAVMFRAAASRLRFEPEDGLQVVASGRVDVYEAQGKLQLYVERLLPQGAGALELAFRQLVQKLQAEGLFDAAHKKPLPGYPERICVITSATGAAIRDIRRTLARRWPAAAVYLILTAVQGESAAGEIARAVRAADANAERLGLDVLIVARGGGSVEDLWSFNAEAVARAIFDCRVPVISGVGHEIDTTIADMVADVRAATPTAAAELATPDREQLRRFCHQQAGRMRRGIGQRRAEGWAALRFVQRSEFFRNPLHRVRTMAQRFDEAVARLGAALPGGGVRAKAALDELHGRLRWCLSAAAKRKGDALAAQQASLAAVHPFQQVRLGRREVAAQQRHLIAMVRAVMTGAEGETERYRRTLEAMNYRNVLRRGYSVTRDARRRIIRCEADVGAGQTIHTELADGEIRSVVDGLPARGRGGKAGSECGPTLFEEPLT